jgi:folate-binding Fe-S cluster repair protein YgfZ
MNLVVFAHLTSRALVAVDGPDARPFLDNLLSNRVEDLKPGEIRAALLLTPQGKFLFDLFVIAPPKIEGPAGRTSCCWTCRPTVARS